MKKLSKLFPTRSLVYVYLLLTSAVSCSDSNSSGISSSGDSTVNNITKNGENAQQEEQTASLSNDLHILFLKAKAFDSLVGKKDKDALIALQCYLRNESPARFSLRAWPCKDKGKGTFDTTAAKDLEIHEIVNTHIPSINVYLSTQKLTDNMIKLIKKDIKSESDYVVFYPHIDKSGNLLYGIRVVEKNEDIEVDDGSRKVFTVVTNPAPPGVFNSVY